MSVTENIALSRRVFEELWNAGNLDAANQIFAADTIGHDPAAPEIHDVEGFRQLVSMYRAAFPDLHFTIDDIVGVDDKVFVRWTTTGTHTGAPLQGMPATGKRATVTGMIIDRFVSGKIQESWANWDTLGLLQQLGAIPTFAPASASAGVSPQPSA
jgi:steroid delta-isomerase-like uncharacterized protein